MGVHCLTGRRGSGKTTRCVETIRKLLGTGAPILFLVYAFLIVKFVRSAIALESWVIRIPFLAASICVV